MCLLEDLLGCETDPDQGRNRLTKTTADRAAKASRNRKGVIASPCFPDYRLPASTLRKPTIMTTNLTNLEVAMRPELNKIDIFLASAYREPVWRHER